MSRHVETLDRLERELQEVREALAAEAESPVSSDVGSDPNVVRAAEALAAAVAKAQGVDLPLRAAPGASLPVFQVPAEAFAQMGQAGGVGISIVVAEPPEGAFV